VTEILRLTIVRPIPSTNCGLFISVSAVIARYPMLEALVRALPHLQGLQDEELEKTRLSLVI
jgi:hypothetical protein